MTDRPIFILGAPRSGTTFLRNSLDRHPNISILDETNFFYYVYERRNVFGDLANEKSRRLLVDRYLETELIKRLDLPMDKLADYLMIEGTSYPEFFIAIMRFNAEYKGKTRFGEKTPHNSLYANLMNEMWPECRMIHIIRDPRAVTASLLRMPFSPKSTLANAKHWYSYTYAARKASDSANFTSIRYEDLISNPQDSLCQILEFVGEDTMPEIFAERKETADAKINQDQRWWSHRAYNGMQSDHVDKWREELDDRDVAIVEWHCQDLMEHYGYEMVSSSLSAKEKRREQTRAKLEQMRSKFQNLSRIWYHWVQPTQLAKLDESWRKAYSKKRIRTTQ